MSRWKEIFMEKESIEIIIYEENIGQGFRLKNIAEKRNYWIKEINQNELISKKYEKGYRVLNYIEHLIILISTVWMHFHFCFWFFSWYSCQNYEFFNRIKNLSNNCRN